jgi:hypothetical protein
MVLSGLVALAAMSVGMDGGIPSVAIESKKTPVRKRAMITNRMRFKM